MAHLKWPVALWLNVFHSLKYLQSNGSTWYVSVEFSHFRKERKKKTKTTIAMVMPLTWILHWLIVDTIAQTANWQKFCISSFWRIISRSLLSFCSGSNLIRFNFGVRMSNLTAFNAILFLFSLLVAPNNHYNWLSHLSCLSTLCLIYLVRLMVSNSVYHCK